MGKMDRWVVFVDADLELPRMGQQIEFDVRFFSNGWDDGTNCDIAEIDRKGTAAPKELTPPIIAIRESGFTKLNKPILSLDKSRRKQET